MERKQRWQDWVMLAFGVWLFFSPFIFQFSSYSGIAAINEYVLGIAVAAFAITALVVPRIWEEWVNLALGVWILLSPFVLGFYGSQLAESTGAWNNLLIGLLIGGDAAWAVISQQQTMHPVAH